MHRYTLLELLTGLAIVVVLAAIAIPGFREVQLRVREAEVRPMLLGIVDAQIAYMTATDYEGPSFGAFAFTGSPGKQRRQWAPTNASFSTIGFEPDGETYANYAFNVDGVNALGCLPVQGTTALVGNALAANAWQDLDGDGLVLTQQCCEGAPGTAMDDYEPDARCGKNLPNRW